MSFISHVLALLALALWLSGGSPEPVAHLDTGCHIDPLGGCSTGAEALPVENLDEGCIMDPLGGCRGDR